MPVRRRWSCASPSIVAELRDARTWLICVTSNLALDRERRAKVRHQTGDFEEVARFLGTGELSAEAELITAQRRAGVFRHIDTLPAREREVLLLSAANELSNVEIASVLKNNRFDHPFPAVPST
jgi:RNA polymerase sigma-70 factor, ECF subfamily